MSITPDLQQTLFPYLIEDIAKTLKLNTATVVLWHRNGYLSFNIEEKKELNNSEHLELNFIHSLFHSGISLKSIDNLLSTLEKPYAYHPSKVYYDFTNKDWKYLPKKTELDNENYFDVICSLLDDLDIEDEKETIQLLIEDLQDRLSETE